MLDFSGPFEVFATAARLDEKNNIAVFLIGETVQLVVARNGFTVKPGFTIQNHPQLDLLIIPGGVHAAEMNKKRVITWISDQAATTRLTASVCTGAFLLAEAGLLHGRTVTTHWEDVPALRDSYPDLVVLENVRWVEDGPFTTSAGISAGIDMSLSILERLFGIELAEKTARQMDYAWDRSGSGAPGA